MSVPENCKIGSSWVLHTHIHQIKFPLFTLFSLQFIPCTIAKPIFLNHRFHHVLLPPGHLQWFSVGLPIWSHLSSLTSEPPASLVTWHGSPFSHCFQTDSLPFGQASLRPAPDILSSVLIPGLCFCSCCWVRCPSPVLGLSPFKALFY